MSKVALITGILGQDGSHLADLLLCFGYEVHGVYRRAATPNFSKVQHLEGYTSFKLHEGDVTDLACMANLVRLTKPHEFYHLAAMSHVGTSFTQPLYTAQATGVATLNCLEAIRLSGFHTKFYNAATSELFGGVSTSSCNEETPFYPKSPYGVSKLYSFWSTKNYREAYRMFACSGILFNHDGPRRGDNFVTRKITRSIAAIKLGKATHITLGDLTPRRDISHAKDMVKGMYLILQQADPKDYVLGSGIAPSIREVFEYVCSLASISPAEVLKTDTNLLRPSEVQCLIADASKARKELGWIPQYTWQDTLKEMYEYDLQNSH